MKKRKKKTPEVVNPGFKNSYDASIDHRLTISINATNATNIQIRSLVEESQQLEREDEAKNKHVFVENNPQTSHSKTKINNNEREKEREKVKKGKIPALSVALTIYHWYSSLFHLFQRRCIVKFLPL